MAFTDSNLRALKGRKTPYQKWDNPADPALKGFGVQVSPGGQVAFILKYTLAGKRTQLTLDRYPGVTLATARAKARKIRGWLDAGLDPKVELRRKREGSATVADLLDWYILSLEEAAKRSAHAIRLKFDKDVVPLIGSKLPAKVDYTDILLVLNRLVSEGKPRGADVLRSQLHAAFEFARRAPRRPQWASRVPAFDLLVNPVHDVDVVVPQSERPTGERFLDVEEVHRFWNEAGIDIMDVRNALALKLLLSTGQRVEEILESEWSDFDFEERLWTNRGRENRTNRMRKRKNKTTHLVPLTDFTVGLLNEARQYSVGSKWLFPRDDRKAARGSDSLGQALARYCRPQGKSTREPFPWWTPRDCRRTFKTLAGRGPLKISKEDRDRLQGHAVQDVSSRNYDMNEYMDEKREAMERWNRRLESIVSGASAGKVVELRA